VKRNDRTAWVRWYQNVKVLWVLLHQEMNDRGDGGEQVDHVQVTPV